MHLAVGLMSIIGMVILEEGEAITTPTSRRDFNAIYTSIPAEKMSVELLKNEGKRERGPGESDEQAVCSIEFTSNHEHAIWMCVGRDGGTFRIHRQVHGQWCGY